MKLKSVPYEIAVIRGIRAVWSTQGTFFTTLRAPNPQNLQPIGNYITGTVGAKDKGCIIEVLQKYFSNCGKKRVFYEKQDSQKQAVRRE